MAKRQIFREDAACLYKKCRPVEKFDRKLWELLDDMADTMYQAEGVGLAAPQIGILRRAFVIDCGDGLVEMYLQVDSVLTSGGKFYIHANSGEHFVNIFQQKRYYPP